MTSAAFFVCHWQRLKVTSTPIPPPPPVFVPPPPPIVVGLQDASSNSNRSPAYNVPPPPPVIGPDTPVVEQFVATNPAPGRDAKGRFTVGNPGGRRGPNKSTIWLEALFEAGVEELGRSVMVAAKRGDMAAVRIALDRVSPARRGRQIEIPNFPKLTSAADVPAAHAALIDAVTGGLLSAEEAKPISDLIANFTSAIDATFADRLAELERLQACSARTIEHDATE